MSSRSRWKAASRCARGASCARWAGAAIIAGSVCRAKTWTRSPTACSTRTTSRACACSWWAAATARSRPPSPSRRRQANGHALPSPARFLRPKPENTETIARQRDHGRLRRTCPRVCRAIRPDHVVLRTPQGDEEIPNDVVFVMIGREAPLDFFRRAGVKIAGEMDLAHGRWRWPRFVIFCTALYNWKSGGWLGNLVLRSSTGGRRPSPMRSRAATRTRSGRRDPHRRRRARRSGTRWRTR